MWRVTCDVWRVTCDVWRALLLFAGMPTLLQFVKAARSARADVGLARTIYKCGVYIQDDFGRGIIKYTIMYDVHIRSRPTLAICMH